MQKFLKEYSKLNVMREGVSKADVIFKNQYKEMKTWEMPVPLCTAGEEKLAGEPGGRKGWRRRQAESAAKMPPATRTPPNIWERERERDMPVTGRVSAADG